MTRTTTLEDYRRYRLLAERCYINPRRRGEYFGLLLGATAGFLGGISAVL